MKNLIIKFIPKITEKDIQSFGIQNNVVITESEAQILLHTIREEYPILLSKDYLCVFEKIKPFLSKECYDKALELFLIYQKKYNIF